MNEENTFVQRRLTCEVMCVKNPKNHMMVMLFSLLSFSPKHLIFKVGDLITTSLVLHMVSQGLLKQIEFAVFIFLLIQTSPYINCSYV
jgi:hypothetical protein